MCPGGILRYGGRWVGRPLHILIVDDEPAQAEALAELLGDDSNATTTVVTSGRGALAVVESVAYDAVLIDLGMPEMDGLGLLRELRTRRPTLPAILITGWPKADTRIAQFLALEHTGYVPKPIVLDRLVSLIARLTS